MQRTGKLHLVFIIVLLISVVLPVNSYCADKPARYHLTVLHTNDFHGADYARLAKIAALIEKIRGKEKNVVYLDAGDIFGRGKYHQAFYGELEFAVLNAMGCRAIVLGNNEFKAKANAATAHKYLYARIKQAKFPVLCANVKLTGQGTLLPGVKPYTLLSEGGVKVGIMGLCTAQDQNLKPMKGFMVENPVDAAARLVPELSAKADIILALTHLGILEDCLLAGTQNTIQAIIGGHSHTALREPIEIHKIPIVQAGSGGRYLGRLDLYFELRAGVYSLVKYQGELIPVSAELPEHPRIKDLIQRYMRTLEKKAA